MYFRVQCGSPGAMILFLVSQRGTTMRPHNGKLGVNTWILSNFWHCWWKIEELWWLRGDICIRTAGLKFNVQKTKIMAFGPITSWQIDGQTMETWQTLFSLAPKSLQMVTAATKLKDTCSWNKSYDKPRQHTDKGPSSQSYGFSSSHVWMWELDHKESWAPKNWCFWTVVLEKTLESPLDSKGIKPVHPKGNQSWILIGRTDVEAEAPILWPPDVKNWHSGKDPDAGKDWGQEEKGMTENEMVGWHNQHDGHEFEQGPGVGDGQGSLVCYSPWGHKESDTTEQLNWTESWFTLLDSRN